MIQEQERVGTLEAATLEVDLALGAMQIAPIARQGMMPIAIRAALVSMNGSTAGVKETLELIRQEKSTLVNIENDVN